MCIRDMFIYRDSNGNQYSSLSYQLEVNEWYYISAVLEVEELEFFVNGNSIGSVTAGGSISESELDFLIGTNNSLEGDPGNPNGFFTYGDIDDVNIWNVALSQQEIQEYMNCPPIGNENGLIGYWNFNEVSVDYAIDLSVNGNNGIINGETEYINEELIQSCPVVSLSLIHI